MDSSINRESNRLRILSQHLRSCKSSTSAGSGADDKIVHPVAEDHEESQLNSAAVLVCVFEGDQGELRVILTKRSSTLSSHSGEVSLPGGKAEEGDRDHCDTATREANEEIGLDPSLVDIVTVLKPFFAKNLLRVFPVIGFLSDRKSFTPVPNAAEVEAVFDAPLEMFIKDENRRSMVRDMHGRGNQILVHYFDYVTDNKRYMIWGLTAAVLIRAASVIYQRLPTFVE